MDSVLERMKEDMRVRDLASATQRSYIKNVSDYLAYFGQAPEVLDSTHVRAFQLHLMNEKQFSWGAFNAAVCALRFLYRVTPAKDWSVVSIPYPRRPRKLPVVLSLEEVDQFFSAIRNLRYRAVLMTAYAANVMHHMMEKASTIWSKETGIDRNAADQVEVKRPDDQRDRYLSEDELRSLKRALDAKQYRKGTLAINKTFYRLRLIVLIALTTGCVWPKSLVSSGKT